MAADYMFMASRHHPHHPYNRPSSRPTSFSSNNPYARFVSSTSSMYTSSRRSLSESISNGPTLPFWWSGTSEHSPVDSKRRRNSSVPQRRGSQRIYPQDSQLVNPDIIDHLDNVGFSSYHHEGPYDAVCPERNRVSKHSPLEAVKESNEEALKATPRDKIMDCLNSHRPLDGTAFFEPGTTDRNGQFYDYEEGSNMMDDYGHFMRLPGKVSILPCDKNSSILTMCRNLPTMTSKMIHSTLVRSRILLPSCGGGSVFIARSVEVLFERLWPSVMPDDFNMPL